MIISARVFCQQVIQYGNPSHDPKTGTVDGEISQETVTFKAIYGSSENDPNRSYSAATPNLDLTMTVTNKNAFGAFVPGRVYDLTFSPTNEKVTEPR